MQIKDKVAIVTGGASGLGRATAEALIKAGLKVAIFDLNNDEGEKFVAAQGDDKALYVAVNVTDDESVQAGI